MAGLSLPCEACLPALLLSAACCGALGRGRPNRTHPSPSVLLAREKVAAAYAVAVLKEVSLRNPNQRIPMDELDVDDALLRTPWWRARTLGRRCARG